MAIDDVSDLSRRVRYTSGAGQTAFTYPFRIFEEADLKVYVDDVLQALGIAYNVTGVDNDTGGSVVFLAGLSAGQIVTIYSDTELNRDTDYQQNGPWGSARLNSEFDKLMVIAQELRAKLARALRGSVLGNTVAELPSAADRASKYLYFNAGGDPTVVTGDPSQPITHRVYPVYPLTGDTVIPVPADYVPGSYDLSVFKNGLKLVVGDDYAETSANSITLVIAATTGDVIEFDIGHVFDVTMAKTARVSQFITGITGTTLTLTTISYTPGSDELDIFYNGSRLNPSDYTETNSTTITLASAANSSDEFLVSVGRVTDVLTADRSQIGAALYPITASEIAASVSPTDYGYPPGDVRRYGLNTTPGTTDMTAALQSMASVGGSHLLKTTPGETYRVSGSINLVSKSTLDFSGSSFVQASPGAPMFVGAGVSDVTLKGGKYTGVGASTAFTSGDDGLITFKANGATLSSNIRIYGAEVKSCYTGISCIQVDGLWIEDNEVSDFFVYGILASKSTDFHIDGNNVHDCARTSRTGVAPYNAYGIMGTGDDAGGAGMVQCSISDNHIRNVVLWDGIMSHDCAKLVVSGNTISNVRMGVDIGHAGATSIIESLMITGNIISLTTTDAHAGNAAAHGGIQCIGYSAGAHSNKITIANNQISGYGSAAGMLVSGDAAPITVENCDDLVVTGNIISGVGTATTGVGVYLIGALNRGAVSGNTMSGTMTSGGIRLSSVTGDGLALTGNVINQANVAHDGIYVTGSTVTNFAIHGNVSNATNVFNQATSTLSSTVAVQSLASSGALTIPFGYSSYSVTGTTNITSITATGNSGRIVTLIFAQVLTVTDGSNLKLAGNFTTSGDDAITLICDGTNWYEISRSVN